MSRILIALVAMALAAGTATAQAAPTEVDAELRQMRAEAERMSKLIDALEKQGRVTDEIEKKRAILEEHLARFEAIRAEVEAARAESEKMRTSPVWWTVRRELQPAANRILGQDGGGFIGVRLAAGDGPGVKLVGTIDGSPAAKAGFEAGDIIVAIDGKKLAGMDAIHEALKGKRAGEPVTITVNRDATTFARRIVLAGKPGEASRLVVPQRTTPMTGYLEILPNPESIARQKKLVADLSAKLIAHQSAAKKALETGKYEAAVAAARAAADVDAHRKKAVAELARMKEQLTRTPPTIRWGTPGLAPSPIVWGPQGTKHLEKKIDGLEKRLAALEGRLARIEKLLMQLAGR